MPSYRNIRTGKTVTRSKPSKLLDASKRYEKVTKPTSTADKEKI